MSDTNMAQRRREERQTWDKGGGIRLAENQFPHTVIPDNAHGALIRNLDMSCWIPGSRFARPGMTAREACHNPICLDARSFMISSVPPPMALTLTSR